MSPPREIERPPLPDAVTLVPVCGCQETFLATRQPAGVRLHLRHAGADSIDVRVSCALCGRDLVPLADFAAARARAGR